MTGLWLISGTKLGGPARHPSPDPPCKNTQIIPFCHSSSHCFQLPPGPSHRPPPSTPRRSRPWSTLILSIRASCLGNARRASRAAGPEPGEARGSVAAAPRCRAAAVPGSGQSRCILRRCPSKQFRHTLMNHISLERVTQFVCIK